MDALRRRFPAGGIVSGVVAHQESFGVFLDLGIPNVTGLARITDFSDSPGPVAPDAFPEIGSDLRGVVLAVEVYGERTQIILSLRKRALAAAAQRRA